MVALSFISAVDPSDALQVISLYRAEGWWYDDGRSDLDTARLAAIIAGSHCFIVARKDRDIVGMGRAISDGASDAYIQDVTVRTDCRGQRIGSRMVQGLVDRLTADGLEWIALIAEKNSSRFYTGLGFHEMPDACPMRLDG